MQIKSPDRRRPPQLFRRLVSLIVATLTLTLTACAAPSQITTQSPGVAPAPAGPRILRIGSATLQETFYTGTAATAREFRDIFHAGLTYFDASGALLPKLATKVPSIADGDWKVLPDGRMEVTWKLKPGLTWQDGAPLTTDDYAFAFQLFRDRASGFAVPSGVGFVGEVNAPDPYTLVFQYPRLFNGAAVAGTPEFPPVPKHLLADQLVKDGAAAVTNSPFWSTGWVGLGPFRMTSNLLGSQIQAEAFDQFVFGRPKIDRLVISFVLDPNALVAHVIAGEVDVVPIGSFQPDDSQVLKQQWQANGQGTVVDVMSRVRQYQWQFRDQTLPWASDLRVRRAMLSLIDRQAINDSLYSGRSQVADAVILPTNPLYAVLERRGLPRRAFDRPLAERLLDEAGWPRGGDGLRRNAAGTIFTHNPLVIEKDASEALIVVDAFKSGGIRSAPVVVNRTATDVEEQRAKADSNGRNAIGDQSFWDRFRASQINSADTRWRGANNGGYTNPAVDALYDRWVVTLDQAERFGIEADFHKLLLDDVAYLPTVYDLETFVYRKGIVGPKPFAFEAGNATIDIHTWTLD